MTKVDFSAAREKLNRANKHIKDLDAYLLEFTSTNFYEIYLTPNDTGQALLGFKYLSKPGPALTLIMGDAVSNLRSTLDYAAVAMLTPLGIAIEDASFPFADQASGLIGMVNKTSKSGVIGVAAAGVSVTNLIAQRVQPYKGGAGEALWMLNKLRNIDKHRLLIATIAAASVTLSFRGPFGTFNDITCMRRDGQDFIALSVPLQGLQFTAQPKVTFEVEIDEPVCGKRLLLPAFLADVSVQIEGLLDALDQLV